MSSRTSAAILTLTFITFMYSLNVGVDAAVRFRCPCGNSLRNKNDEYNYINKVNYDPYARNSVYDESEKEQESALSDSKEDDDGNNQPGAGMKNFLSIQGYYTFSCAF